MKNRFVLIPAVFLFCSCSFSANRVSMDQYSNASHYTPGNATISESIETLDLTWMVDDVSICYHTGSDIIIEETNDDNFTDEEKLYWYLDSGKLYIKFCKSGYLFTSNKEKKLNILIPYSMSLENIIIDNSSGDLTIEGIKVRKTNIKTSSGNAYIEGLSTEAANIESSSGNLNVDFASNIDFLSVKSSSGNMKVIGNSVNIIVANTSSGDVKIKFDKVNEFSGLSSSGNTDYYFNDLGYFDISSSSGKVTLAVNNSLETGCLSTSSGGAHLYVPKNSGFCADIKVSSGNVKIENNMICYETGKKTYYVAASSSKTNTPCKIETKSGDLIFSYSN